MAWADLWRGQMGVSGDVVSREVVMLINRWWQPYSFAGASPHGQRLGHPGRAGSQQKR